MADSDIAKRCRSIDTTPENVPRRVVALCVTVPEPANAGEPRGVITVRYCGENVEASMAVDDLTRYRAGQWYEFIAQSIGPNAMEELTTATEVKGEIDEEAYKGMLDLYCDKYRSFFLGNN